MQRMVHLLVSGESRNPRNYTLVYLITILVAVQQKTSNIAEIETCSYRESKLCFSLFLIACYYRTYWAGRTDIVYCLATRVRATIYYETARDMQCTGAAN